MKNYKELLVYLFACTIGYALVSCSEEVEYDTQTSITYTLTISPDLLKFVVPQVKYVDEDGVLVTVTGVDELDKMVIENKAEISGDGYYSIAWSSQVIKGTNYKAWSVNMKFRHNDFHSYMGVKYLRNELAEDPTGNNYSFHHSINTSISAVTYEKKTKGNSVTQTQSTYVDNHVTVSLDFHPDDDVESYIENLVSNPDKVGYYIDPKGVITRRDEFDL